MKIIKILILVIFTISNYFLYGEEISKFTDLFKKEKEISIQTKGTEIGYLYELRVDLNKDLIFLDRKGCQILIFDNNGNFLRRFGRKGEGPGEFKFPISITIDNNNIFVLDFSLKRISKFDKNKGFINSFIISSAHEPAWSIKVNSEGFIFLKGFKRKNYKHLESGMWINKYTSKEKYLTSFFPSNKFNKNWVLRIAPFCSFDIDKEDIIYAVQHCDYKISKYNSEGKLLKTFGKTPSYFKHPNIKEKVDFKRFSTKFELLKRLKELSVSWTKLIDIIVVRNRYILLILEMNNLIKEFDKKYVIDIWDREGNFIVGGIQTNYRLLCKNKEDCLYFLIYTDEEEHLERDPLYIIGKYCIKLN